MSDNAKSTREHFIDVGLDLMHQHGYQATGVKEILHSANVPKGSFYHHFASEEDFAAAALEKYTAREAEHSAAFFNDSKTPPLTRLKRYFSDLLKGYWPERTDSRMHDGAFHFEIADEGPQLRKRISTSFARWQHKIAIVIEQAVTQKELPADTDPESLAGFRAQQLGGGALTFASGKKRRTARNVHALRL